MNGTVEEEDNWRQHERELVVIIWTYSVPIMMVLGTLGNVLSIVVFCRKSLRKSVLSTSFIFIAVIDLAVLYCSCLPRWLQNAYFIDLKQKNQYLCKIHVWISQSIGQMSPWSLVVVTLDRLLSVFRPLDTWTENKGKMSGPIKMMILWGVFLLTDSHIIYGFGETFVIPWNMTVNCGVTPLSYAMFFINIWIPIFETLTIFIPFLILLSANCAILWKLRSGFGKKGKSDDTQNCSSAKKDRAVSSMKIVLMLNLLFLVANLPNCVFMIGQKKFLKMRYGEVFNTSRKIIMYINNSTNFLFYLIGRQFRREFVGLFWKSKEKENRSSAVSEFTTKTTLK